MELHPKVCNLCGGKVDYVSNARIYGKQYGSGYCYLCRECGAYTGTHKPRPKEALGLLADARMRKGKILCHELFDPIWKGKPKPQRFREKMYKWLSRQMGIRIEDFHFGYFDLEQLREAYAILQQIQGKQVYYSSSGDIYFAKEGIEDGYDKQGCIARAKSVFPGNLCGVCRQGSEAAERRGDSICD